MQIRLVPTNIHGQPVGAAHHWCRWPDAMVEHAKALRAEGMSVRAIAAELRGPHFATVFRWLTSRRRRPAARITVRRVKPTPITEHESDFHDLA